jgi:predicted esterase
LINKKENKGQLIVAGFSQGCGMALHCLYHSQNVDAVLGIAGYLFPITKFDPNLKNKKRIIYGLADKLRPW